MAQFDADDLRQIIRLGIKGKGVYLHPVTFELIWNPQFVTKNNKYLLSELKEKYIISDLTWDTIAFSPHITSLRGYSRQNGNSDIRGGGCGLYDINVNDFDYTIHNENGITIKDIIEVVYRLKGSKYDTWYEMFVDVQLDIDENMATLKIKFDYVALTF